MPHCFPIISWEPEWFSLISYQDITSNVNLLGTSFAIFLLSGWLTAHKAVTESCKTALPLKFTLEVITISWNEPNFVAGDRWKLWYSHYLTKLILFAKLVRQRKSKENKIWIRMSTTNILLFFMLKMVTILKYNMATKRTTTSNFVSAFDLPHEHHHHF